MSWIVSLPCTRAEAEALSGEIPALDALAEAPVVVTREIEEDSGRWQLDAYVDAHPDAVAVECPVNGEPGIALHTGHDIVGVLTVGLRADRISRLWLVVNPEKLRAWNAH